MALNKLQGTLGKNHFSGGSSSLGAFVLYIWLFYSDTAIESAFEVVLKPFVCVSVYFSYYLRGILNSTYMDNSCNKESAVY